MTPWTRASLLVSVVERPPFLLTYLEPCRVLIQLLVLDLNSLRTSLLILKKAVWGAKCEATWRLQKSVRQSVLDKVTISLSADGAGPGYFQVNQLLAMVSYLVSKQVMQFSFKIRAEVHDENWWEMASFSQTDEIVITKPPFLHIQVKSTKKKKPSFFSAFKLCCS